MPSDAARRTAAIVGAGQAGARTAAALRKKGWQDRILLVGDEVELPYERPPLSKEVLSKHADPLTGCLYPAEWYKEQEVELRTGTRVGSLDVRGRRLHLADGRSEAWDALVLATGARARRLCLPGADLDGILTLRTAADARALRAALRPGAQVVLVGGGFIGLELAASAGACGCRVTLLEARSCLLDRALPRRVADYLADRHRAQGIDLRLGVQLEAFEGDTRVRAVRLADGTRLAADLVVVGVGSQPNVELAATAGLPCDDGVLAGPGCAVAPGVHAVGDCARFADAWSGGRVRLESWENAELAPQAAAAAILGDVRPYGGLPWFWTDQYDLNLQLLGTKVPLEREVLRGDPYSGSFCHFGLAAGRIVTAALVNAGRERRPVKRLIEQGVEVDAERLADPHTPLKQLAKAA